MKRTRSVISYTLVAAFTAGASLLLASPSFAANCTFPSPGNVSVQIKRLNGPLIVNNERSRVNLRHMQNRLGHTNAFGPEWTPVGLTLTELSYNIGLNLEALPLPNGHYCARLTSVDAALGYENTKVYIARKFRPGSCAYRSINDHEMTHVAVFRQALDAYFPRLQRRLDQAARQLKPVLASSPDQAARYLRTRLNATVKSLYLEMNRVLDRNNAKLDTPERYRLEQARCAEW